MSDPGWYQRKLAQMRQPTRPYSGMPANRQAPAAPPATPVTTAPQPQAPPNVTIENLYEAMGYWHGGKAHQVDRQPCPRCGSNQFFSRTEGSKRGPPPAPHCYNCGYNDGMFEQGLASSWGG